MSYGNGKFVAAFEAGIIFTSLDGLTWERQEEIRPRYTVKDIVYFNGMFVGPANDGSDQYILTSTDGLDWPWRVYGNTDTKGYNTIVAGNDYLVAAQSTSWIATSRDGITWDMDTAYQDVSYDISAIAYGDGVFVSVGENGAICRSVDGIAWEPITEYLCSAYGAVYDEYDNSIAYGNGVFIALIKLGKVVSSSDGIHWKCLNLSFNLAKIFFLNNQFVGFNSENGIIYVSSDGNAWKKIQTGFPESLRHLVFANGEYVAFGDMLIYGILKSQDGINWTYKRVTVGWNDDLNSDDKIFKVVYGNNLFVIVPFDYEIYILTSFDGGVWTEMLSSQYPDPPNPEDSYFWKNVLYNGERFVFVTSCISDNSDGHVCKYGLYTTKDCVNWNLLTVDTVNFHRMYYLNNKYLSFVFGFGFIGEAMGYDGYNGIRVSEDCIRWNELVPANYVLPGAMVYGNGVYVMHSIWSEGLLYSKEDPNESIRRDLHSGKEGDLKIVSCKSGIKIDMSKNTKHSKIYVSIYGATGRKKKALVFEADTKELLVPNKDMPSGIYLVDIKDDKNTFGLRQTVHIMK
jgi:hypothetical protein